MVACGNEATEESAVTEEAGTEEVMDMPAEEEMAVEETPATEAAEAPAKAIRSEDAKPAAKATKTEEVIAPKKSVAKTLSTQKGEEAPATATERPAASE